MSKVYNNKNKKAVEEKTVIRTKKRIKINKNKDSLNQVYYLNEDLTIEDLLNQDRNKTKLKEKNEELVELKKVISQNLNELSDQILELLNDKEELIKMGRKGQERVTSKYSWKKAAELHLELYKKLIR